MKNRNHRPVTLEELEQMLLFVARLADKKGDIVQPLLDRLEREYIAAKNPNRAVNRVMNLINEGKDAGVRA
jgi:hypothetical protein